MKDRVRGRGLGRRLRDAGLYTKVALTLTAVFAAIAVVFLAMLLPFLREQRTRLLDQDKRLLSTLRDKYQHDFVYDLLAQNEESLAVSLAAFASQPGIVWVRIEAGEVDMAASADAVVMGRVLGGRLAELRAEHADPIALLVHDGGVAEVIGTGGRRLLEDLELPEGALPAWRDSDAPSGFEVGTWERRPILYLAEELGAPGDVFGRLHVLYSLAQVQRAEALTSRIFYGLVGSSFLLLLALLNLLLSRIVIAPLRRVLDGMSQASTGDLRVRLPVHSRDEIGEMSRSFNAMVEQLEASRREVEDYSRNLEEMVAVRTRALRESEARLLGVKNRLATVIATVATGVISVDRDGRITTFNERAAEILAPPRDPSEGQPLAEVLRGGEGEAILDFVSETSRGAAVRHAQVSIRRSQGRRTLSLVGSPLVDERGEHSGLVVVLDDLTELLAHQRLHAWKEAVERVIHEIKNPLTPVGLAAQTLRSAHAGDPERFEKLFPSAIDMILDAVRNLKELILEFTRFSRLPEIQLAPEDVNALVREALAPYAHAADGDVGVELELSESLPAVEADREQLKRVLLNVVNNGLEAMEGSGGRLEVRTAMEGAPAAVLIRVTDHGPGVEDVERIFEPHYTTKVKGTGLGLAIARQIVEEHGGGIEVESQIGSGTTVTIRLPAARPAA